jgi:hypothetical protein
MGLRDAVISHSDGPRHGAFQPSISATGQSLDSLDTLADSNHKLLSLIDLLPRARPVASRAAPQVINLTVDSNNVSQLQVT